MKLTFIELFQALSESAKWARIALYGLKRQFKNTRLGPLWFFLPNAIFIVAVTFVYSAAFNLSPTQYFPYLAYGYIIWMFILDTMSKGGNVYVAEYGRMSQMKTNLFGLIYKEVIARSIVMIANIVVCVFVVWCLTGSTGNILLAILGIVLLVTNSFMASYWLSSLTALIRDVSQVVNSMMRMAFFVTPILWFPDAFTTGVRAYLLKLNPFYYMIEIIREPLMDGVLTINVWQIALIWTLLNFALFLFFAITRHNRIIYNAG